MDTVTLAARDKDLRRLIARLERDADAMQARLDALGGRIAAARGAAR
jgi:hypothetical protein